MHRLGRRKLAQPFVVPGAVRRDGFDEAIVPCQRNVWRRPIRPAHRYCHGAAAPTASARTTAAPSALATQPLLRSGRLHVRLSGKHR